MTVHSALPEPLTAAVDAVLVSAGVTHVAHGGDDPVGTAECAAGDSSVLALIGPYGSRDVAEALEASAPAGLPLLAPLATWVGVTREDEPGCDDAARHRGTVFRLVARDTVVAERIAEMVRTAGQRALVVAGDHDYGVQLDGQLRLARLPRADAMEEPDVLVLAGLDGEPEIGLAAELAPLPIVAFDGVQGASLGNGRDLRLALPLAPDAGTPHRDLLTGVERARRAAELVVTALDGGADDRAGLLIALRELGPFDDHGDPIDPPVWLWRAGDDWTLEPERPL